MSAVLPSPAKNNLAGNSVHLELTVTGEDANNNLFREKVPVLSLHGRDCAYQSRLRVQPGSSLMIEIPPARSGEPTWRAAAIVETVSPVPASQDLFLVGIVLGRAYESSVAIGGAPNPKASKASPMLESLPPKTISAPALPSPPAPRNAATEQVAAALTHPVFPAVTRPEAAPVSETQMRELKIAVAGKMDEAPRINPLQPVAPAPAPAPVLKDSASGNTEQIAAALRPMIAEMVREAVASESETRARELRENISQEIKAASQAPMAELTQYAKALPAINEQIIRQTVEQATGQQLVRTTALLQPAVAEMVREAVKSETERQAAELKDLLSREVEKAVQEPLAVMAQYTQTLPAIDDETIRYMVRETVELEFQRATATIQPSIAEILRPAIAAEYERQTRELKDTILAEVSKAIQGPVSVQMAAMLDAALAERMSQHQPSFEPRPAAVQPAGEEKTIEQLMQDLQTALDSLGGTMRCVLEPKLQKSSAAADSTTSPPGSAMPDTTIRNS